MNDDKKAQVDAEAILLTLDQIGQTIDIMTNVVGRLRGYITEQTVKDDNTDGCSFNNQTKSDSHTLH